MTAVTNEYPSEIVRMSLRLSVDEAGAFSACFAPTQEALMQSKSRRSSESIENMPRTLLTLS